MDDQTPLAPAVQFRWHVAAAQIDLRQTAAVWFDVYKLANRRALWCRYVFLAAISAMVTLAEQWAILGVLVTSFVVGSAIRAKRGGTAGLLAKQWERQPLLTAEREVTANDEGVVIRSAINSSWRAWSTFDRAEARDRAVVLIGRANGSVELLPAASMIEPAEADVAGVVAQVNAWIAAATPEEVQHTYPSGTGRS